MAKALAIVSEGSKPLKNNLQERYARLRAAAQPRLIAFRKAGYIAKNDHVADANSFRLERKRGVRERIEYLTRQVEERIAEKRAAIEETLWAIHEANIQDFFTTEIDLNPTEASSNPAEIANNPNEQKVGVSPRVRVVPRPLTELAPETAKLIEEVRVDNRGRLIPRLYSKERANKELRNMLNISAKETPSDVQQLSDAELLQTLARQARELNIEINLSSYTFAQQPKEPDK
jgi:hypothetical protein